MDRATLLKLFDHLEWADALVWRTVLADHAARADAFVVDSLFHIHLVQFAYLGLWRDAHDPLASRDDFAEPAQIRAWARDFHPAATDFLRGLSEPRLADVIETPWARIIEEQLGRPPAPATLSDTILQVASHSGHHRAQVNRRLREVGGTPPMIDYIGWIWGGCPPADW